MKKLLKPILLTLALLFLASAAAAQSPYPSLQFIREPNKAGSLDYVLKPIVDEIHKKIGGADKPYRILGAVARPDSQKAVLMFVNAQGAFQLNAEKDSSVVINADSLEIGNIKYELAARGDDKPGIKLEIANVLVTFSDFQKIARARSVMVNFGGVAYELDKENLNALRYMATEIEKDQSNKE